MVPSIRQGTSGMEATSPKKYWAFISYSSKDKKWGQWLHKRLERYPIPKELQGTTLFDGAVLGKNLSPVFRDRDELSGSAELGPALEKALRNSRYLVVLCSTNSANSKWVDKEIEDFKEMGGERNILALILDGEPNSGGPDECFPPALRYPTEPLAGDLRRDGDGKERGLLKIVAGAAQLDFDSLYRRHERAQRRKRLLLGTLALAVMASLAGLALFAFQQKEIALKNEEAATTAKAVAQSNERRATSLLVSSYAERGRQAFLAGSFDEALAFFHEARQIDPEVPNIDRMMADAWQRLDRVVVGDPANESVRMGALASIGQRTEVRERVAESAPWPQALSRSARYGGTCCSWSAIMKCLRRNTIPNRPSMSVRYLSLA